MLFYEYENSNEALFPLHYLLIKRDSLVKNRYSYAFFNKDLEFQNGFIEYREIDHVRIDKVLLPEKEHPQAVAHVHQIDLSEFTIPDRWAFDDSKHMHFRWTSAYSDTILFEMSGTWSLTNLDTVDVMGNSTDVIQIERKETLQSTSQAGNGLLSLSSEMDMFYAHSIGMVAAHIRMQGLDPVTLKLKAIHAKETYFKLLKELQKEATFQL